MILKMISDIETLPNFPSNKKSKTKANDSWQCHSNCSFSVRKEVILTLCTFPTVK